VQLLQAAIVLAVADGVVASSERGLLDAIAGRVGVGQMSLEAMIDRAKTDPDVHDELFYRAMTEPELTMELLVAAARLDGEVSQEEREVLVRIMDKLNIPIARFSGIYQKGIQRADQLRKAKFQREG
jgi:tellurite resistance protein